MSELIVAKLDEPPEWLWFNWIAPSVIDKALDDGQGWAKRVVRSARHEIARMEARLAESYEQAIRMPVASDQEAIECGSVVAFYESTRSRASGDLDMAVRVLASGETSLRACLDAENQSWLLDLDSGV